MSVPMRYQAELILNVRWPVSYESGGRWYPARPIGFWGLCFWQRLSLAWSVFTGRMDALAWMDPTPTDAAASGKQAERSE